MTTIPKKERCHLVDQKNSGRRNRRLLRNRTSLKTLKGCPSTSRAEAVPAESEGFSWSGARELFSN